MKKLVAFIILLSLLMLYWKYSQQEDKARMTEFAAPFYKACQQESGCIITPEGWSSEKDNSYYKGRFIYKATKDSFKLEWHVTTDTFITATAGKNKEIEIKSRYE